MEGSSSHWPSLEEFDARMRSKGWVVFDNVVDDAGVEHMRADLARAYDVCRSLQVKNGVAENTEFTVHHVVELGESWLRFIDRFPLMEYVERHFGGKFILNSFGGAINSAHSRSYAHNIHRDIRSYSGDLPLLLNTLIMLDDFTPQNGATWLMTGSHRMAERPGEEEFRAAAEQAVGTAGSLLVFDSNLWHAGGDNTTGRVRRSMTPMFCRPFVKQQYDYPRAVGYDKMDALSEQSRQILGYYSRVPSTLDEWYQPPARRMYRPGQG